MKGCMIAAALLLTVVLLVLANAVYIRHTAEEMLSLLEELPPRPDTHATPTEIKGIRELLEQRAPVWGLTISHSLTDRLRRSLITLETNARMGDETQYASTLALLRDLLAEILRLEEVSVTGIF